ncbi:MAG: glycosyltransferase [Polyangiaceae bacterium]
MPALRMVVVCGPRIDPRSLPAPASPRLQLLPCVDQLFRHLAACDLAVVQGGLTTTMELAVNGRPFLYFPLQHHFEQTFHVRHRLERFGAGRCMDFATAGPEAIAAAMVEELGRPAPSTGIDARGAARAAAAIASLL